MPKKSLPTIVVIITLFLLPALMAFAQIIQPVKAQEENVFSDDFSSDSNKWQYLDNAHLDAADGYMVLTDSAGGEGGVAFFKAPIRGNFVANFSYKVGGGHDGGDGFAMFFYKKYYTEVATGGNLGFNGWNKTAAGYGVEWDAYQGLGDPSANHIALIQDVFSNHLAYVNDFRVEDNIWHYVSVEVQESSVQVYVDKGLVLQWSGAFNRTYDGFGFSAATGSAANYHLIDDFSISYQALHQPTLTVFCKSTTSQNNFKVKIEGTLSFNGSGIADAPILLSYSVTGGESWQDLTMVNTNVDGSFSAVWLPSVSGNYMLKATSRGNFEYQSASSTVNFAVEPNSEQNVFSVSSNSTISGLTFDSAKKELSFNVSGANGTSGYVIVCIPNSLIGNISDLKIYVDNAQVEFSSDPQSDSWLLYLTYHHSMHLIKINLASTSSTLNPTPITGFLDDYMIYIVAAAIGIFAAVLAMAFRSWKENQQRR